MLLSRVADSMYWGARYIERAQDTARLVSTYTELLVDMPTSVTSSWVPLLYVTGGVPAPDPMRGPGVEPDERSVVHALVADRANPSSITSSVEQSRENLRTTREVLPRDAWQAVNDLYLFTRSHADEAVERRARRAFCDRIVRDGQRLEGVVTTTMTRDEAYDLWRLGVAIERADMTTRVVGVRAAELLVDRSAADTLVDGVLWMGVLRSVSALQMYQRATRRPIEASEVVRFLLHDERFPRSVANCLERARRALTRLPHADLTTAAADEVRHALATVATGPGSSAAPSGGPDAGRSLDRAMDVVQMALARLSDTISAAFSGRISLRSE